MRLPRGLSLLAGTVGIVGVCYALAAPARRESVSSSRSITPLISEGNGIGIEQRCCIAAEKLRRGGTSHWTTLVRPPFVLTGDLSAEQMNDLCRETILPTSRALDRDYFDRSPAEPIVLVVLATEDSYRSALASIGQLRRAEYSGLYQRDQRTIWVNLSTGVGTLAHELTHALAHADFPEMPEWFDEGLASLHEESEFSPDGRHLVGGDNWRLEFLKEADARGCWKPLRQLLEQPFAQPDVAALDYAMARYVGLFLQERGLLAAYYRRCRDLIATDSTGQSALLSLFPGLTLEDIDQEFRDWVRTRHGPLSGSPKR